MASAQFEPHTHIPEGSPALEILSPPHLSRLFSCWGGGEAGECSQIAIPLLLFLG
jgi:hypothetical protein